MHYCLFVKVLFFLLEVFPEELSFLSFRQLIEFIISSSVCQELFYFIFKLLSKPGCLSLAATVHYFIRTFCLCQAVFYFFEFLFRNPCCFRSSQQSQSISGLFVDVKHFLNFFRSSCCSRLPQQIYILSAFFCSVNSFLKLFLPGVNARLLSTDSPAGMEAASGKLRMK